MFLILPISGGPGIPYFTFSGQAALSEEWHILTPVVPDYRGELSTTQDAGPGAGTEDVKAGYRAEARQFLPNGTIGCGMNEVRVSNIYTVLKRRNCSGRT